MYVARALLLLGFILRVMMTTAQSNPTPPTRTFQPHTGAFVAAADTPVVDTAHAGQVTYIVDPAVERLMRQYTEHRQAQKGYRVQIFLGDRKTAEDTKRTFLQKYPDTPAYLSWLAPNFRLRVGDLRTRLEAERLLKELRPLFPGSYIVPDEIEPPRLPE